ncbi:MAG: amino acid permease [Candidatus Nezhaarchaeales archaeon]
MRAPRRERVRLRRELGLVDAILICTGTIFGADIYIATSFAVAELGPSAVFAWLLAGAVAILMALSMAECSSMFPRAGGPYIYEAMAFGMPVACVLSWAYWAAEWAALATFPSCIVEYLLFQFPQLSFVGQAVLKSLFIAAVMAVLYWGIRETRIVEDVLAAFEKTLLIGFVMMSLTLFSWRRFEPLAPYGWDNLGLATLRVFWAYMGFELVAMPAEEFKNPQRDVPLGIVISMAILTGIYVSTNLILIGSMGAEELAASEAPISHAALLSFGPLAAMVMTVAALASMVASETGTYLGVTRLAFAMSRDGFMPEAFSYVHERHRTPHVSIVAQGLAAMVASNVFTVNQLILFSSFTVLISYTATCLAAVVLRFKMPHVARGFRVPLNVRVGRAEVPVLSLVAAAMGCWLIYHTPPEQVAAGAALLAGGFAVYLVRHLKEGLRPSLSGLEVPTLKALSTLGRWASTREVASEVFDTPSPDIKQLSLVAASLERLYSRYGRVYRRREGGEDLWLYRPRLAKRELELLARLAELGWAPVKLSEVEGYSKEAASLIKKGVLVEDSGLLRLSDRAYADLAERRRA